MLLQNWTWGMKNCVGHPPFDLSGRNGESGKYYNYL